jgi:hypothetical protein
MANATWKPSTTHESMHKGDARKELPESAFAFPKGRKEPLTDADHVRNAMARFDQVKGISDEERDVAWANIKKAAKHYKVEISETDWHELGKKPHTKNPSS